MVVVFLIKYGVMVFMKKDPKILLFYDIAGFMFGVIRLSPRHLFASINFSIDVHFDAYFTWLVNYILRNYHGLNVIETQPYHSDEFKTILSTNETVIVAFFNDSINLHHLGILRGHTVKTIVNGSDLIVTRAISITNLID
jgi:hypothetical protein